MKEVKRHPDLPLDPRKLWAVPPLLRGETLALLGSGAGMSQQVANYLRGKCYVLAINDNYLLAPWCDFHWHCDVKWWNWAMSGRHPAQAKFGPPDKMSKLFQGLRAIRMTLDNSYHCKDQCPRLRIVGNASFQRPKAIGGLSQDRRYIRTGGNSGFQCLNIAYHLEPRRLLLCGYNMQASNDRDVHWFGQHPVRTSPSIFLSTFRKYFDSAAPLLQDKGIEVINCTPGSALTTFPIRDLREVL